MENKITEPVTLIRRPQVESRTGHSCSTVYAKIADGTFVPAVAIGKRSVGWPSHEVDSINSARIAGRTDDEIRTLVAKLVLARKSAGSTTH